MANSKGKSTFKFSRLMANESVFRASTNMAVMTGGKTRVKSQNNQQLYFDPDLIGNLQRSRQLGDRLLTIDNMRGSAAKASEPAYHQTGDNFGVLKHVFPTLDIFKNAQKGIGRLRDELDVRSEKSGKNAVLVHRLTKFIDRLYDEKVEETWILDKFFAEYRKPAENGEKPRAKLPELTKLELPQNDNEAYGHVRYLFEAGYALRDDIRMVEMLRSAVARFRNYQQRKLKRLYADLDTVDSDVPQALRGLSALNRDRLETLADYQVARQLVAENWEAVARQYLERRRVLEAHRGLFFVKAREIPVCVQPAKSLPLRRDDPADIVPGCGSDFQEALPEELDGFLTAVFDIPLADWRLLAGMAHRLPGRNRLRKLALHRQSRLQLQLHIDGEAQTSALALRMRKLHQETHAAVRSLAGRKLVEADSLLRFQHTAAQVLALQDLFEGPPHRLRGPAEQLRNRLEQATQCLMHLLGTIAPSVRLTWAHAAELDELPVDRPEQWPAMERAKHDDFSGIRTMVDLVHWWFRQLSDDASSSSFTAVRNLIRAALMTAADDNPQAILHGHLTTLPERFLPGRALRLALNREAVPGTLMQMMDQDNRLVGVVRVDDQDDEGAVATITRALADDSVLTSTQLSVIGFTDLSRRRN